MTTNKQQQFPEEKAFSDSLQTLAIAMRGSAQRCDAIRQDFLLQLDDFGKKFRQRLDDADGLAKVLPIQADFNDLAKKTCLSFAHAATNILDPSRLCDEFKDQFIVFVYGKVKSGKSSLGNLVAKYASDKAAFFRFAEAGQEVTTQHLEEIDEDELGVAATEATTAIQGFRLPGLCWVDSPGLHSTTAANGQLSEKYVAAADLVLFLANSDNPARNSNLQEICALLNQAGKAMVVVLTRSDCKLEDEVNGEVVQVLTPKSPAARRDQEKNMAEEIAKYNTTRGEILSEIFSVSKKVADEAHRQQSPALWQGSNIGHLLQVLTGIMSQDAIRLKAEAPIAVLRNALERIMSSRKEQFTLATLRENLLRTRESLAQNHDDFDRAFTKMARAMQLDAQNLTEKIFNDCAVASADKGQALSQALAECMQQHCQNDLQPILRNATAALRQEMSPAINQDEFTIEDNFQEITIAHDRSGTGAGWGKAFGTGIGTLGFFAGPWVGMATTAFGSWLGGKIGKAIGADAGGSETMRIKTGDNALAKLASLKCTVKTLIETQLDVMKRAADQKIYADVLHKIDTLIAEIDQFKVAMNRIINH